METESGTAVFSAVFLDQDGDFTCWQVAGPSEAEVLRRFLMDVMPETAEALIDIDTVEGLEAWAEDRECFATLVKH